MSSRIKVLKLFVLAKISYFIIHIGVKTLIFWFSTWLINWGLFPLHFVFIKKDRFSLGKVLFHFSPPKSLNCTILRCTSVTIVVKSSFFSEPYTNCPKRKLSRDQRDFKMPLVASYWACCRLSRKSCSTIPVLNCSQRVKSTWLHVNNPLEVKAFEHCCTVGTVGLGTDFQELYHFSPKKTKST